MGHLVSLLASHATYQITTGRCKFVQAKLRESFCPTAASHRRPCRCLLLSKPLEQIFTSLQASHIRFQVQWLTVYAKFCIQCKSLNLEPHMGRLQMTHTRIPLFLTWNLQVCLSKGNVAQFMGHMNLMRVATTNSTSWRTLIHSPCKKAKTNVRIHQLTCKRWRCKLGLADLYLTTAKNIDYNRMELRKIWHDGRFSAKASDSPSGTQQVSF